MSSSSRRPTAVQSTTSSLLLVGLSLALSPLTVAYTAWALLRNASPLGAVKGSRKQSRGRRGTALVNGGRMQKSLYVARALARQGWRVVVVEEEGWGLLSPARFSRFVDVFHLVPSGGGQRYVDALVAVARKEDVDLFVPCSGAGTTHEDALTAEVMRKTRAGSASKPHRPAFQAIIQDPELVLELHEKDKFITLTRSYDLDAPESVLVHSPSELLKLLRSPNQPPRILKCAAELDDVGRSDLTLYPLRNKSGDVDWQATERRIQSLPIPISNKTPYIAQEFIGGSRTSEWCTHATVDSSGSVRAFVCCPSNDMLMTYHALPTEHPLRKRALQWTRDFLAALKADKRWEGRALQGHYSFDFIHQPGEGGKEEGNEAFWMGGRLVGIECNPRVHTAVGLLAENPAFGAVYGDDHAQGKASDAPALVVPLSSSSSMSWLAHDVPARYLPYIIPRFIRTLIHPLWLTAGEEAGPSSSSSEDDERFDLFAPGQRDAAWDKEDPLPFFAFYHVTWPYLVLRQIFVRRRRWSRINVSTARIFEC